MITIKSLFCKNKNRYENNNITVKSLYSDILYNNNLYAIVKKFGLSLGQL